EQFAKGEDLVARQDRAEMQLWCRLPWALLHDQLLPAVVVEVLRRDQQLRVRWVRLPTNVSSRGTDLLRLVVDNLLGDQHVAEPHAVRGDSAGVACCPLLVLRRSAARNPDEQDVAWMPAPDRVARHRIGVPAS